MYVLLTQSKTEECNLNFWLILGEDITMDSKLNGVYGNSLLTFFKQIVISVWIDFN